MEVLIAWCGFLGAWLLVAGPLLQAAMELRQEDEQVQRFEQLEAAGDRLASEYPAVSAWWWLLPPVRFWLQSRRSRLVRTAVMRELTTEQLSGVVNYLNKATGWLFVAGGASLIAVKETWELTELQHWPHVVFWVLLAAMVVLCTANAALRMRRAHRILGTEPAGS